MRDTTRLENAYRSFGNVMHVENWFKAECFAPPIMRNADAARESYWGDKAHGEAIMVLAGCAIGISAYKAGYRIDLLQQMG